ncbi:hypothetical protein [Nocardia terpenica]|uniref:Uncharacterized protein n=1 Tax=Nocardia terpenica TaxID=455432 RepID=A0A161Z1T9_9NOCA|nr:hypothetical protein [Nocardia terpenica]KZM72254.1 hypothetical protein AWN90_36885 [Nocardia terpenica]NQE86600.1 hypothetical protein [Nocardia terpenica]
MPKQFIEYTWTRTSTEQFTYKQPLEEFIDQYKEELGGDDPEALSPNEIAEILSDNLSDLEEDSYLVERDSDVDFVSHKFL